MKIVRVDDIRTKSKFPKPEYCERYNYGRMEDISIGAMIVVEHVQGTNWGLHVQETRTKAVGDALQTYVEGKQKIYELKLG